VLAVIFLNAVIKLLAQYVDFLIFDSRERSCKKPAFPWRAQPTYSWSNPKLKDIYRFTNDPDVPYFVRAQQSIISSEQHV